ncbi:MAG: 6-bladed beta-propeller [Holophagales bacterium]|nr:6-bladed beta-propeller [Holophagales bacterium]
MHFERLSKPGLTACLVAATLLSTPSLPAAGSGKEVARDGVTHVMNPAAAAKTETLELEPVWRVGGEDDEDVLFGVITDVILGPKGNFYLLDSQLNEIQVYSPKGEHLRTIGREGEGPGEFRFAFNLILLPDGNIGVLQAFPGKIVVLTPEGEPAGLFPIPETGDAGFKGLISAQNAGEQLAVIYTLTVPGQAGFSQNNVLALVDGEGKKETRIFSQESKMSNADAVFAESEWDTFRNRWAAAPDGRLFAATEYGAYSIHMWDSEGELVRVIHRESEEHPRTTEEVEKVRRVFEGFTRRVPVPNMKFEIEESWNPIQALHARSDGTLWVRSSRGTFGLKDGVAVAYEVFDEGGQLVRQVRLKGDLDSTSDGIFFVGDRMFVVTDWLDAMMALQGGAGPDDGDDDDAEPMEVLSFEIH